MDVGVSLIGLRPSRPPFMTGNEGGETLQDLDKRRCDGSIVQALILRPIEKT